MSDIVERLRERTKLKYIASTKTGNEQFIPLMDLVEAADEIDSGREFVKAMALRLPALQGCVIDSMTAAKAELELYQHYPSRLPRIQRELDELRVLYADLELAISAVKEKAA